MSRHDDNIRLQHMFDHAMEATEMARGRKREALDIDRQLNLSLVRLLEIVGEAANHVSPSGQAAMPEIPWAKIIGLRNRITHGYYEIDFDVLWEIIQHDLPPLISELEKLIRRDDEL